jgi:hypothetical protein
MFLIEINADDYWAMARISVLLEFNAGIHIGIEHSVTLADIRIGISFRQSQ